MSYWTGTPAYTPTSYPPVPTPGGYTSPIPNFSTPQPTYATPTNFPPSAYPNYTATNPSYPYNNYSTSAVPPPGNSFANGSGYPPTTPSFASTSAVPPPNFGTNPTYPASFSSGTSGYPPTTNPPPGNYPSTPAGYPPTTPATYPPNPSAYLPNSTPAGYPPTTPATGYPPSTVPANYPPTNTPATPSYPTDYSYQGYQPNSYDQQLRDAQAAQAVRDAQLREQQAAQAAQSARDAQLREQQAAQAAQAARDAQLREQQAAQALLEQQAREAQIREQQAREAQIRDQQAREAQIREQQAAQLREQQAREAQALFEKQERERRENEERERREEQERKEKEQKEREQHERAQKALEQIREQARLEELRFHQLKEQSKELELKEQLFREQKEKEREQKEREQREKEQKEQEERDRQRRELMRSKDSSILPPDAVRVLPMPNVPPSDTSRPLPSPTDPLHRTESPAKPLPVPDKRDSKKKDLLRTTVDVIELSPKRTDDKPEVLPRSNTLGSIKSPRTEKDKDKDKDKDQDRDSSRRRAMTTFDTKTNSKGDAPTMDRRSSFLVPVAAGAESQSKKKGKKENKELKEKEKALILTWHELSKFDLLQWHKGDGYYRKKISVGSKEFTRFLTFFNETCGVNGDLEIEELIALYNPDLVSNFNNFAKTLLKRHQDSAEVFKKTSWKAKSDVEHRQWVMSRFEERTNSFSWNIDSDDLAILPVCHGTSLSVAEKICQTGFAMTQGLDAGYYGQGIYFSSNGMYTIPYFCSKSEPCILLCYLLPGNPYPVGITEARKSPDSLLGTALQAGYQSHYVITTRNGELAPMTTPHDECFDEIVLIQEAQVIPAYIIRIAPVRLSKLALEWARAKPKKSKPKPTNSGESDKKSKKDKK